MEILDRLVNLPVEEAIVNESISEELIQLQQENATLKAQILALKNALRVFTD